MNYNHNSIGWLKNTMQQLSGTTIILTLSKEEKANNG